MGGFLRPAGRARFAMENRWLGPPANILRASGSSGSARASRAGIGASPIPTCACGFVATYADRHRRGCQLQHARARGAPQSTDYE